MKVLVFLALFGYASAGNVIVGAAPTLAIGPVAHHNAVAAAQAQLVSNAVHNANGVAQIHNAAVGQAIDAENAAIRDQVNLNNAVVTQEFINQDGHARNAIAAAAINNYANVRNAAIQADQISYARYNAAFNAGHHYAPHYYRYAQAPVVVAQRAPVVYAQAPVVVAQRVPVVYAHRAAYPIRTIVPATQSFGAFKARLRTSAIIDRAFASQNNFIRSPHFRNGVGAPLVVYNYD